MSSWFPNHQKHFLKTPLRSNTALEEKQSVILRNKKPTHSLHLTLAVIHVANETQYTSYFESAQFVKDVRNLYEDPSYILLDVNKAEYTLLGTKPECFAIVIDTGDAFKTLVHNFKTSLCLFLCQKLSLVWEERLIDEKYNYTLLVDKEGVDILKIPWSSQDSPLCHITLFTSFDLKRCNRALFKLYEASEDKLAFLSKECGEDAKTLLTDK